MPPLAAYFWVALGSAVGGVFRFGLGAWMTALAGLEFPWGTLVVNLSGSFVIGCLAGAFPAGTRPLGLVHGRDLLMTGVCGGYTTFSAFSLQVVDLWQRPARGAAGGYVGASVLGCVLAAAMGVWCGQALVRGRG